MGPLHFQVILLLLQLSMGLGVENLGGRTGSLKDIQGVIRSHQWKKSLVSFNEEDLKSVKIVFS